MCGIVGYVGPRDAVGVLLDGLRRLEYRGYDSAGVAVLDGGACRVVKTVGKIADLEALLSVDRPAGQIGIGHTRWATHGQPSTPNAHPHAATSGRLAIVHNGIIENYCALREELRAAGCVFASETDSEVIAQLLEVELRASGDDLPAALRAAARRLRGAYAVAVVAENCPDRLHVVRKQSPLVLGLGEGEVFLASDIPALLPYTRRVILLEDGDVACLTAAGVTLSNLAGEPVERPVTTVDWDVAAAEKGGWDHYMIKEIHEIPEAIRNTLRGRLTDGLPALDELGLEPARLRSLRRICLVACGTSYYAGVVGKYLIERLLRLPVEVDIASEFRYRRPILDETTLVVVISQSGETADTLAALREAKRQGVPTLGIVNVVGSSIHREADAVFTTLAGPEICVASTKAYVTQLVCEYLLCFHLGLVRGALDPAEVRRLTAQMEAIPSQIEAMLADQEPLRELSRQFVDRHNFFFLGRGLDQCVSLEGALKLKEISYLHAESYAAGELKHGPLALLGPRVPVLVLATQSDLYEKTLSNIKEVKARRSDVLAVVRESNTDIDEHVDWVIRIPEADDLLMPLLAIVPPYLLTYWLSAHLGREIDQPRNLAKSVTVE